MSKLRALGHCLVMVIMAAGTAHGAPTLIGSITDGIDEPSRVAVDSQGNVYVAETNDGIVYKFDRAGNQVASVRVPRPYGVAVNASGVIYVGSVQVPAKQNNYVNKSAVYVYSPAFVRTGTLGAAEGEFEAPVDIAIGTDGSCYVSDMKKGIVKVFDAQGAYQHSIGGGYLRPTWTQGVAVDDSANSGAGEVYVVDSVLANVQGYVIDMPRISVFSKNGALLRSFGQYGTELGKMRSPRGIAVGRGGLLYVADSGNNVVHTLSSASGAPVGEGGLYASGVYRPSGVAVSRSNVAYVAWQGGRRVDAFGLDGFVTLAATPLSLSYATRQYGADPASQAVTVANAGTGTLNWTASSDEPWITLGPQAAAAPGSSVELAVGVDAANLVTGSYSGTVTITSEFGEQASIGVSLSVAPPLLLNISNWSPALMVKMGNSTAAESIVIAIDGGEGNWSLSTGSLPNWLGIAPTSGTSAPTTVTFTANAAGLSPRPDPYVASVPVSAPGVVGDGSKLTVSLTVAATSSISVSTNRPDATFQVSGPASFAGSGKNWSVEDVPAGDYTVTFGTVPGYRTPSGETRTLAYGGAVSFTGTYVSYRELAAKKNIAVARGPGALDDARVKVYKNNGAPVAFDLVALDTLYGASVAAGDIDGDGVADLVTGAGKGPNTPAVVRVYRAYDRAMMAEFVPFGTLNGATVAAADLNGDGKAEIIVSDNAGMVAVYTVRDGSIVPTGIELSGMAAAAADTEGDGRPEIVTVSASGLSVWKPDTAAAVGSWTAAPAGTHPVAASSVAAADVDGDGQDELLAGTDGADGMPSAVVILEEDGSRTSFPAFDGYGTVVAGADLDGDGKAEIIAGAGIARTAVVAGKAAKPGKRTDGGSGNGNREEGTVRVYSAAGILKYVIRVFDEAENGVRLTVGDLGL